MNYYIFLLFIVTLYQGNFCMAKIQYLENGANYIRICCDFDSIEVYEITYDEDTDSVLWSQTLNSTSIMNVTLDTFVFSNIRKGYIIPLIQRYNFQLYKWYVLCLNNEISQDCIYVRPCDCNCITKSWLKYNITATAKSTPSDEFNITISTVFDNTSFPLPILPNFSWFAADWDVIMMCQSGQISPTDCDFMLSGSTTSYTHKSISQFNITLNLHLDSPKIYFSLSLVISPRWDNRLPTVEETTFIPQIVEFSRNDTMFFKQYVVGQVYEDKLSGREPTSATDKARQCTDVGSVAMADALKQNGSDKIQTNFLLFVVAFLFFAL